MCKNQLYILKTMLEDVLYVYYEEKHFPFDLLICMECNATLRRFYETEENYLRLTVLV